jgi:hypothetical protein
VERVHDQVDLFGGPRLGGLNIGHCSCVGPGRYPHLRSARTQSLSLSSRMTPSSRVSYIIIGIHSCDGHPCSLFILCYNRSTSSTLLSRRLSMRCLDLWLLHPRGRSLRMLTRCSISLCRSILLRCSIPS